MFVVERRSMPTPARNARLSRLALCVTAALIATSAKADKHDVTNCADAGQGTLRALIAESAENDLVEIDATVCSTITLTSGEIEIPQNSLEIAGDSGIPNITAADHSRIFNHQGSGTLGLYQINVSHGHYVPTFESAKGGGCIASSGTVYTRYATVSYCEVDGQVSAAYGGAIDAYGVGLRSSTVSASSAVGSEKGVGGGVFASRAEVSNSVISGNIVRGGKIAYGGGLAAGVATINASVISTNTATTSSTDVTIRVCAYGGGVFTIDGGLSITSSSIIANAVVEEAGTARGGGIFSYVIGSADAPPFSLIGSTVSGNLVSASLGTADGGGLYSQGNSIVYASAIDHNRAKNMAAAMFVPRSRENGSATIENSTVAYNSATEQSAISSAIPFHLWESTVANNQASGDSAGVYLYSGAPADLRSSIIAVNTSSSANAFDLIAHDNVSGDHNLIQNPAVAVPPDTLVGIGPLLGPLANNGGPTRTLALLHNSAAIDAGADAPTSFANDQRGQGFPRQFGNAVDIGAFEWQGGPDDPVFGNGFEP